eukprot:scaffold3012_cov396-Prasinococcus_capsulatus_cf.AAC.6
MDQGWMLGEQISVWVGPATTPSPNLCVDARAAASDVPSSGWLRLGRGTPRDGAPPAGAVGGVLGGGGRGVGLDGQLGCRGGRESEGIGRQCACCSSGARADALLPSAALAAFPDQLPLAVIDRHTLAIDQGEDVWRTGATTTTSSSSVRIIVYTPTAVLSRERLASRCRWLRRQASHSTSGSGSSTGRGGCAPASATWNQTAGVPGESARGVPPAYLVNELVLVAHVWQVDVCVVWVLDDFIPQGNLVHDVP